MGMCDVFALSMYCRPLKTNTLTLQVPDAVRQAVHGAGTVAPGEVLADAGLAGAVLAPTGGGSASGTQQVLPHCRWHNMSCVYR